MRPLYPEGTEGRWLISRPSEHLLPPGGEGGYLLPGGVLLHRRAGRRQWQFGPELQELEAQLKAREVDEQGNGLAVSSLGAALCELRFPKG